MIGVPPATGTRRRLGVVAGLRRVLFGAVLLPQVVLGCGGKENETVPGRGQEMVAAEVIDMLHRSAASWNAGDLEGFLDDYWRSDELTFSGGTGVTRGWEDVRERYLRSYWAPGVSRDSLRFEGLAVTALGEDHALALGEYVLYRPDTEEVLAGTGHFSLVLRRLDGQWRIIHDHTSATPSQEGEG
jgi:uncharacterized protein (TIGR02246 family)